MRPIQPRRSRSSGYVVCRVFAFLLCVSKLFPRVPERVVHAGRMQLTLVRIFHLQGHSSNVTALTLAGGEYFAGGNDGMLVCVAVKCCTMCREIVSQ